LADYAEHQKTFEKLDIGLVALSADSADDARAMAEEVGAEFPIVYGLEVPADAEKVGAYYQAAKKFFHATAAIVAGDTIDTIVYSSGAVGRLDPENALRWVRHLRKSG
jgi:peroxiredoxin